MKHLVKILVIALFGFAAQAQTLSGTLNPSSKVTNYNRACGCVTLSNAQFLSAGDRVLLIQMQGASVSNDNSDNFGAPSLGNSTGKFEFNTVSAINGNSVSLVFDIQNAYEFQNGSVQMIKVAVGTDLTLANVTARKWDGSTGGVLVVEASNSITISGTVDASASGFRGGVAMNANLNCGSHEYSYPQTSFDGAAKGEGVAINSASLRGRGAWSNGGGGGNNHNAGGGGGANAGNGGFGGFAWGNCSIRNDAATRGFGGFGLNYNASEARVFMGGGAGAGHRNDNNPSNGGQGGGIVILSAPQIVGMGGQIICRGANGQRCEMDGAGGGGAGGSVVLLCDSFRNAINVDVCGGKGGDTRTPHGPGGGGSAGVVAVRQSSLPVELNVRNNGGLSGMNYELGSNAGTFVPTSYGSTNGDNGIVISSFRYLANTAVHAAMVADLGADRMVCKGQSQQLAAVVSGGVAPFEYTWSPKTGLSNERIDRPTVTPEQNTVYSCTVRDANGCVTVDSVRVTVVPALQLTMPSRQVICTKGSTVLQPLLHGGSGDFDIRWTPSTGLSAPGTLNTIAAPTQTTMYTLNVIDRNGCSIRDSVLVSVENQVTPVISGDSIVCAGTEHVYTVQTNSQTQLLWTVAGARSLVVEANGYRARIIWGEEGEAKLFVSGDMVNSCVGSSKMLVHIVAQPTITISASATTICSGDTVVLDAGKYSRYEWSSGASSRTIKVTTDGIYSVRVWNEAGCESSSATSTIKVLQTPNPVITVQGKNNPCSGDRVVLDAGEWSSYLWSNGETTRLIVPSTSGKYSVRVSNAAGCQASSAAVNVAVGNSFAPSVQGKTSVCAQSTETYSASGFTNSYFSWNIDGASDIQFLGRNNDSVNVTWAHQERGSVVVTETTTSGCSARQRLDVSIESPATPHIVASRAEIFNDELATLDAGEGYASYMWSSGQTTRFISIHDNHSYSVVVTNSRGCVAQSAPMSIVVRDREAVRVLSSTTVACEGESINLQSTGGLTNIVWSNGMNGAELNVMTSGQYFYTATQSNGKRVSSDTISIRFNANPKPSIQRNGSTLYASTSANYQWLENGVEIFGAKTRSFRPSHDGVYAVRTITENGCTQVSDEMHFNAILRVEAFGTQVHGAAGNTVSIGLSLNVTDANATTVVMNYSVVLRVRKTMIRLQDNSVKYWIDGDDICWTMSGVCGSHTDIVTPVEILLGDTTSCAIVIENITLSDSTVLNVQHGRIDLDGACSRSGARSLDFGSSLSVTKVFPNPSTDEMNIEYTLAESGETTIQMVDCRGSVAKTLLQGNAERGAHSMQCSVRDIPSGKYLLVLQSPSRSCSTSVVVNH